MLRMIRDYFNDFRMAMSNQSAKMLIDPFEGYEVFWLESAAIHSNVKIRIYYSYP
jgi:hypothetical protein